MSELTRLTAIETAAANHLRAIYDLDNIGKIHEAETELATALGWTWDDDRETYVAMGPRR